MFSERLDALMSIAEVSNSLLGREVDMSSSHICRLRSGTRPLPKKHEFVRPVCEYLAACMTKEYQLTALRRLTGIKSAALTAPHGIAQYLETWLLEPDSSAKSAAVRLISGFSGTSILSQLDTGAAAESAPAEEFPPYLYGNAGKRKGVEQLFRKMLLEDEPQTLLMLSEENLTWLFEDDDYAVRWTALFKRVLQRGNRVRIIHTVSRNIDELIEWLAKWIPIYMTGAVEPFYYPRPRDGIAQRTLLIAPKTAAVVSSSVQQNTSGMLNMFITDKPALDALTTEFGRYFALCRPLMQIYSHAEMDSFHTMLRTVANLPGDAYISCPTPPLFTMPKALVSEIAGRTGSDNIISLWTSSLNIFRKKIKTERVTISVLEPEIALMTPEKLTAPMADSMNVESFIYTEAQYRLQLNRLAHLESLYENLTVRFRSDIQMDTLLFVKEDKYAVMAKADPPITAFVISEHNIVSAFRDYMCGRS